MFYKNPRLLLSEAAAGDMLDPQVAPEVKETIEELEDDLTNNVEENFPEKLMTTNGGIQPTTDTAAVLTDVNESAGSPKRYYVALEDVISIMEAEGEEAAAEANDGAAPSPEAAEAAEPEPENVVDQIAAANGVDPADVTVVISNEHCKFLAETAILESKCGKKNGKATKKVKKLKKVVNQLKGKVKLAKG